MITVTQAKQYLDQALGVSVPDFLVSAAVDRIEATEPAMSAAGYDEATMTQVQTLAVAIVATAGAARRIQSQGAPSGASRSFKYPDADLSALRRTLLALDTAGTVAAVVGPDPSAATALMVVC